MASSSAAATCNGAEPDVSGKVKEDEVAMQIRLLEVQMDILADGNAQTKAIEDRRIKAAVFSKASISIRKGVIESLTSMKDNFARLKSEDFEIPNDFVRWWEFQQACLLLSNLLVFDKQRNWESRILKQFWRHAYGISDADLLLFLSKLHEHYSPSHGPKPHYWTLRDHTLHSVSSFSESVKPLELIFPFSARFETAKECLDRLDLLKSVAVDLSPDESDTSASLRRPEFQALHALKKEMELHGEVALQLEQLSGKHLHAYKELSNDQLERPDEFFRTCQEESRNVVQVALYKKAKCLASIEKANINRQAKFSEDILKGIVQKAGSAFKEVKGKLKKARLSGEVQSKECTLCYSEFSRKRKRACLDPCGHASACIDCATTAWARKPYCPWCNASIQKPVSIPARIFL